MSPITLCVGLICVRLLSVDPQLAKALHEKLIEGGAEVGGSIEGFDLDFSIKHGQEKFVRISREATQGFLPKCRLAFECMLIAMKLLGGASRSRYQQYAAVVGGMKPHADMLTLAPLYRIVLSVCQLRLA